ncbi:LysR family transcriptional regulator [Roseivivax marinus]|uniref:LysR family transcriptional regulator n=1 Tax=Roseivivax marinus TaxID=1379903 RepID=UPI001F03FDCB|nr:LysR family transcriptional regulator [Roseivivax marinus]UMA64910.1 LysR family transcriptional regulator [Roseivivax marinus]
MSKKFSDQDWHPPMRSLRYFVCVAEEKSFTRAAGRLRVAQPALSRQIAALEDDLGVPVFTRMPRGVELTEAGEILLERTTAIFGQLAQTYRDVTTHAAVPRGLVVVGMPPTPGEFILPPLLARVRRDYPELELRFVEGFSRELERAILAGEIGVAVMHEPPDRSDIHRRELLRESLHLIGPPEALAATSYTLAEAAQFPLIMPPRPNYLRVLVDREADARGIDLNVVQRVDGVWHLKALLRGGHGYSLLTQGAVMTEIHQCTLSARPVRDPVIEWELCVATREDQRRKMAISVVEDAIYDVVTDLAERGVWR